MSTDCIFIIIILPYIVLYLSFICSFISLYFVLSAEFYTLNGTEQLDEKSHCDCLTLRSPSASIRLLIFSSHVRFLIHV